MNFRSAFTVFFLLLLSLKSFPNINNEVRGSLVAFLSYSRLFNHCEKEFWNGKEAKIIEQIGQEEFEMVKKFSDSPYVPCEMKRKCIQGVDTLSIENYIWKERLTRLNFYKIAKFNSIDKYGKESLYCILAVRYNDNKNWIPNVKWETVYFFTLDADVQEIQMPNIISNNISNLLGSQVKVKDYGRKMMILPPNYWLNKSKDIISQIGIDEFKKVITFSYRENIPCEMELFCEDINGMPKKRLEYLKSKLSTLKVYKISSFTHFDNAGVNRGRFCILRVPYSENKSWDENAKWDNVYFVITEAVVEDLNIE